MDKLMRFAIVGCGRIALRHAEHIAKNGRLVAVCDIEKSKALHNLNDQPNEFIVKGRAIYLYCPNGFSNSKLTINFIESKLKLTASSRNWNTVLKLLEL